MECASPICPTDLASLPQDAAEDLNSKLKEEIEKVQQDEKTRES